MNYVSVKPIGSQQFPHSVRAAVSDRDGNYLLEVTNNSYAEPELLAIVALSPEIKEYLKVLDTPLSRLLISQIGRLTQEFSESARGS